MGENSGKRYLIIKIWRTSSLYLPQIFEKLSNGNLLKFPKAVIEKIIFEWRHPVNFYMCLKFLRNLLNSFPTTIPLFILRTPQPTYSFKDFSWLSKSYKGITGCLAIRTRNQPLIRRQSWISYLLSTEMNEVISCGNFLEALERNKLKESNSEGNRIVQVELSTILLSLVML